MSVRALILGGEGMLGRALAAEGRRRGWPALALSSRVADVLDAERLTYWLGAFRPDVVIGCAAYTNVDAAESHRDEAFRINATGAANAARTAAAAGVRLVHISTDYVFDGRASRPYLEGAPTAPLSVYGESKLAGEEAVLAASDRHLVVRTSWLFGTGGPSFVDTMVRLMREGKVPLRVVDDQLGCPTYTPFLATALWDLAEVSTKKEISGVIHYRNRDPVSWFGFAREIARLMDPGVEVLPISTDEMPRPAPRPVYSVLDVTRFETLLGRRVEPWGWGLAHYLEGLTPVV